MAQKGFARDSQRQTPGPTQAPGSGLPANPSDEIYAGRPLPIIPPQAEVMRRPFSEPTRNPLHYLSGPGTDEIVSGRNYQGQDFAEGLFGPKSMEGGRRPTSKNDVTLNGQEIRGTC